MPSTCLVSAADYARSWGGAPTRAARVPYEGPDRRTPGAERRATAHDRRWEQARGRRFHDRRRPVPRAGLR